MGLNSLFTEIATTNTSYDVRRRGNTTCTTKPFAQLSHNLTPQPSYNIRSSQ
jgi:hypothetical protein